MRSEQEILYRIEDLKSKIKRAEQRKKGWSTSMGSRVLMEINNDINRYIAQLELLKWVTNKN